MIGEDRLMTPFLQPPFLQPPFFSRVGDTVYDNLTGPAGMPFDKYVQLFRDSARLTFTASPR